MPNSLGDVNEMRWPLFGGPRLPVGSAGLTLPRANGTGAPPGVDSSPRSRTGALEVTLSRTLVWSGP